MQGSSGKHGVERQLPGSANGRSGVPLIGRIIWFLLIGWWLTQIAIVVAWVLNLLVLTLPIGLHILNRIPQIATLRPATMETNLVTDGSGSTVAVSMPIPQRSFLLRSLYFLLVGWWFSLIWLEAAWFIGVAGTITVVLIPLAWPVSFAMFGKSAAITTLRRT